MTRPIILVSALLLVVITAPAIAGQAKEITRDEFWNYMRRSIEATKDKSYRTKVTIHTSDIPDGGWTLYSSWVCDYVFPDRSHMLYTHRLHREIISIGRTTFAREPGQPWARSESEKANSVRTPAGIFGYAPSAQFLVTESDSLDGARATLIRVVSKADFVQNKSKDTRITSYWLDESGALIRNESIVFNESSATGSPKWQRRIETYEYSPDIRIEPPIN